MNAYFISGLGADRRAFCRIKLPAGFTATYIDWIAPLPKETLSSYALRLAKVIDASAPFVLIGLSMGGMMSVEIAKVLKPKLVILISSIKCRKELPWYYKLAGTFYLDRLMPASSLKKASFMSYYFVGTPDHDSRHLLKQLTKDSDLAFVRWAIRAILTWKNTTVPENIFHIHGTKDNILPIRFTKPDVSIPNEGHFMVYTKGYQVSEIIRKKLDSL